MKDIFITDEDLEKFNNEFITYINNNNIKSKYNRPKRIEFNSYYEYLEYLVSYLESRKERFELKLNPTEEMIYELSQELYERNKVGYDKFYRDTMDGDKQYISWEFFDALLKVDSLKSELEQEINTIDEELNYKKRILNNHNKSISIATRVKTNI